MVCEICEIIEQKKHIIFENNDIVAFLSPNPCVPGHIIVAPRKHFVILDDVPDSLAGELFVLADELTSVLFQSLGSQGTNILVNNGIAANQDVPHFCINVLPRSENDGLNIDWEPKKVSDDELATKLLLLSDKCKNIGLFNMKKPTPMNMDEREVISSPSKSDEPSASSEKETSETKDSPKKKYKVIEDNYLIRQLKRMS